MKKSLYAITHKRMNFFQAFSLEIKKMVKNE